MTKEKMPYNNERSGMAIEERRARRVRELEGRENLRGVEERRVRRVRELEGRENLRGGVVFNLFVRLSKRQGKLSGEEGIVIKSNVQLKNKILYL